MILSPANRKGIPNASKKYHGLTMNASQESVQVITHPIGPHLSFQSRITCLTVIVPRWLVPFSTKTDVSCIRPTVVSQPHKDKE